MCAESCAGLLFPEPCANQAQKTQRRPSLAVLLLKFSCNVPQEHCRLSNIKKYNKGSESSLFPKEETLKVANHSLETVTKQMGFDTSGWISNANMSIYALAQVLHSSNLFGGCLGFLFKSFVL